VPTHDRGALERALVALAKAKLDFIVVGMFGINLHARSAAERFVTEDVDVLLEPSVTTLKAALRALSRGGFLFETAGEPFVDIDDESALKNIIRYGATLRGTFDGSLVIDLMLSMTGFTHEEVSRDARRFRALGFDIRVGSLEMLLESKRRSGRPKDLRFLEYYEAAKASEPPAAKPAKKKSSKKRTTRAK
jgi:hypothetical protein